jgi:hypothetical protein
MAPGPVGFDLGSHCQRAPMGSTQFASRGEGKIPRSRIGQFPLLHSRSLAGVGVPPRTGAQDRVENQQSGNSFLS